MIWGKRATKINWACYCGAEKKTTANPLATTVAYEISPILHIIILPFRRSVSPHRRVSSHIVDKKENIYSPLRKRKERKEKEREREL